MNDDIKNTRAEPRNEEGDSCEPIRLPELLEKGSGSRTLRRRGGVVVFALSALALVLVVTCLAAMHFSPRPEKSGEEQAEPSETAEFWRGAFDSRAVYENCRASAVSILEGTARELRCSGFVLGDEGWIISSMSDSYTPLGRLYALLEDGREFEVESIRRLGVDGLVLLKVPTAELEAVKLGRADIHAGERLYAIYASQNGISVCSGELTQADSISASVGVEQLSACAGAALFDSSGTLVGVITVYPSRCFTDIEALKKLLK